MKVQPRLNRDGLAQTTCLIATRGKRAGVKSSIGAFSFLRTNLRGHKSSDSVQLFRLLVRVPVLKKDARGSLESGSLGGAAQLKGWAALGLVGVASSLRTSGRFRLEVPLRAGAHEGWDRARGGGFGVVGPTCPRIRGVVVVYSDRLVLPIPYVDQWLY